MEIIRVEMKLESLTYKHVFRYEAKEDGRSKAIEHLYIRKHALGKKPPRHIIVAVET